ncbi:MAG: ROK family transcriptional regulator [Actinobacteria bacterium]|nr:ROK family transcriptional regulator [Actinomycetota bacterium]
MKKRNLQILLESIRNNVPISRADLEKVTGLARPTISALVSELISADLVTEIGYGNSRGGKKPILLEFNKDFGFITALDLGAVKYIAALLDLNGNILDEKRVDLENELWAKEILDSAMSTLKKMISDYGLSDKRLIGIGVASPGAINPNTGAISIAPNIKGLDEIDVRGTVKKSFDAPVFIDSSFKLAALGEKSQEYAKNSKVLMYVDYGIGIGLGIIIDNKIFRGATYAGGEIGYLYIPGEPDPVDMADPKKFGYFENTTSGLAYAKLAQEKIKTGIKSIMLDEVEGNLKKISAKTVFDCAKKGDLLANEIIDQILPRFAIGIANAVILFNPDLLIIGGGISRAGEILLEPLKKEISKLVPITPQIMITKIEDRAPLIGAWDIVNRNIDLISFV